MDLGLTGKVALVTGSSRGIGRATAMRLAAEGARVVVSYRESRVAAERAVERIQSRGGEAMCVALDLASSSSIRDAAAAIQARWGDIDVLINNAIAWSERASEDLPRFEDVPARDWREPLRVNIEGAYEMVQAVLPSMRSRQWGRIVNVSSVAAVDGRQGSAWYAAAKSALHGLTRTLAKELGRSGILVNVVMPGLTLTQDVEVRVPDEVRARRAESSLIGRLLTADEVATSIVFLSSEANTAITGELLRASGGRS